MEAIAAGRGVALWRQVADRLRHEVAGLAPGSRLAGEAELARRFGVNRHTVRRALAALAGEGLIRVRQGSGTFVAGGRLSYPIGPRTRFSEIVSAQARAPGGRLVGQAREPADRRLAEALAVREGTPLLRLDTLHIADRTPISAASNWFPADRFASLVADYAETGSLTEALTRAGAGDYRRRSTRVTARPADERDRLDLGLPPGGVVLVLDAVNVDGAGVPLQASRARFAADRVELMLET